MMVSPQHAGILRLRCSAVNGNDRIGQITIKKMGGNVQATTHHGNAQHRNNLLQKLRRRLINPAFAEPVSLYGKHFVVTGAALGSLGFETARILTSWGARVVVTTRSHTAAAVAALQAALDESLRGNVVGHPLDLCQRASVQAFADWYRHHSGGRLHVLINNAGIHLDLLSQWKQPMLSSDGFELHWRTNFLGTVHLTQLLLPQLITAGAETGDARIVNVVSQLHKKGSNAGLFNAAQPYDSWVAYGNSKLALVHFTFELQRRFAHQHVQAYCLHPGAVVTNIASKGLAGNPLIETVRNAFAPVERFFLTTTEEGAQTSLYCATEKSLQGGRYFQRCNSAAPSRDALNAEVSSKLWENTQSWLGS